MPEGGFILTPLHDWELRGPDDVLVGLILVPRGNRRRARILAAEGSWRVDWAGGPWRFIVQDEKTRQPAAYFERRRLRPGGRLLVAGGAELRLLRGGRGGDWSLAPAEGGVLARFSAPRDRHREQALRFSVDGTHPLGALLVAFTGWLVVEMHRFDRRLWRMSRRSDPDFGYGWVGHGGGGGGGGDGGGGG